MSGSQRWAGAKMWLAFALVLGTIPGCGGSTASLSGKVSFEGKPVDNGSIRLDSIGDTQGLPAASPIQAGQYAIPASAGLVPGEYRVTISASRDTGKKRLDPESGQQVPVIQQLIPEKYNSASTLTVKLEAGENTKDFDLTP